MILLGTVSLWLALVVAVWGAVVGTLGLRLREPALERSAARAPAVLAGLLAVACLSLVTGLVGFDPRISYVIANATRSLPTSYRALGLVTGPEGALLVCLLVAATVTAALQWAENRAPCAQAALGIPALLLSAGLLVVVLWSAPFAMLAQPPVDGNGPDPALRHALLAIGPPLTLVGGGLALAAWSAATGATDADVASPEYVGRLAWGVLTAALIVAAWWSYRTPVWGIGWVPLDAALVPWLALSGYVVRPARARVGVPLLSLAAGLVLVGLFAVPDVRAPRSTAFGWSAAGWMVVAIAGVPLVLPLVMTRLGRLASVLESHRAAGRWRRVGVRVAGSGAALVAAAAAVAAFTERGQVVELAPGESARVAAGLGQTYQVRQLDVSAFSEPDRYVRVGTVQVAQAGDEPDVVSSEWRQYVDVTGHPLGQPVVRPGLVRGLVADLQLVLDEVSPDGSVRYRARGYPLVNVAIVGGLLLLVGGVLVVIPEGSRE
jgi:cytochrome c biogenesis factor